ncbi:ComEC/Rec2 family competence protein [Streptomyces rubiginosohelvolus]|uniref:ComEC/Rec2 family competence protein n=1 Tax=Streptomyces rubiginosohelvolus TaxID=67362 RepID=UPI0037015A5B
MHEVDFLPVESESGMGSKSGDAIALRFTVEAEQRNAVMVIDGGFSHVGEGLADHISQYYETDIVDLAISTHPDADHLNGLTTLIEKTQVKELLIHQPRLHTYDVSDFSNLEALDSLISLAKSRGVKITEPFTGVTRFGGQISILGPTVEYYEDLLGQHLAEVRGGLSHTSKSSFGSTVRDLLSRTLSYLPIETLGEDGETSPRNSTSAITLLREGSERLLFTGDSGIRALGKACDEYERIVGEFSAAPLNFFQAPHHGSRRNLSPSILDRILGTRSAPYANVTSFISSAKVSEKHPSPKVVNALSRRGCEVFATEGRTIHHGRGAPVRMNWTTLTPFGPLSEEDA